MPNYEYMGFNRISENLEENCTGLNQFMGSNYNLKYSVIISSECLND